ncbi:hypothetical protein [Halobaculum sp. P14]|uniref:hypothetical protein n=1 Tax=Halobaculum sp. P14 TaxID=3421638 RepID=UPI003EB969A2
MKRELQKDDLESLNTSERELLLKEQVESYRRLREQSQQIIRVVLISLSVIVALATAQGSLPKLSADVLIFGSLGDSGNASNDIWYASRMLRFTIPFLILLILGFISHSVIDAVAALTSDGMLPISKQKAQPETGLFNDRPGIDEWIIQNDKRLTEVERRVQQSYFNIYSAILCVGLAYFVWLASESLSAKFVNLAIMTLDLSGPAIVLFYVYPPLRLGIELWPEQDYSIILHRCLSTLLDRLKHKGPGRVMLAICFLFYFRYLDFSHLYSIY